jgi:hypothetical protein
MTQTVNIAFLNCARFRELGRRNSEGVLALIPRLHLYIHGPEMKEFLENFDELNPVVLHYSKGRPWLSIVGIEKKVQVNLPSRPCVERGQYQNYDPSMVIIDQLHNDHFKSIMHIT